jgi:hypothetical protein
VIIDVLIPVWAAREENPVRGLKKALFYICICNLVYLLLVMFAYPRLE